MNIIDRITEDVWVDVARRCPWATYFHTPSWASVITATFPQYSVASMGFELEGGLRGVLPLVCRKKKGVLVKKTDCKSMEPGVYGGIIADGDPSRNDIARVTEYLCSRKGSVGRIVETPFKQLNLASPFISKELTTHILDLTGSYDAVRKGFNRGQKSNINQAKKKSVAVRRADNKKDIETYCDIYYRTVERWGKAKEEAYPRELFLNLFALADPNACFWLAEAEGEIIAGILVLAWNKNIVYWHGCSLQKFFKHYPNNLLHAAVIEWGCANGYTAYDMGASMGLEGVIRFKESFGARPRGFRAYRWK